jgi:hypothetical protein
MRRGPAGAQLPIDGGLRLSVVARVSRPVIRTTWTGMPMPRRTTVNREMRPICGPR